MSFLDLPDTRSNQYYLLASSVIFYYDFALTLSQEYKFVWLRKLSAVDILVLALRYLTAASYLLILVLAFAPGIDMDECASSYRIPAILGIICQTLTAVFSVIRIVALYERARVILLATVPLAVLNVALSCVVVWRSGPIFFVSLSSQQFDDIPGASGFNEFQEPDNTPGTSSCYMTSNLDKETRLLFTLSYSVALIFDALIFILCVCRTVRMYQGSRWINTRFSLVSILLRDGCVLFAVLAASNLFILMEYVLGSGGESVLHLFVTSSGTTSEMTHALSAVLVPRMIFNLREAGTDVYEGTQEWHSRMERSMREMEFRVPTAIGEDCTNLSGHDDI